MVLLSILRCSVVAFLVLLVTGGDASSIGKVRMGAPMTRSALLELRGGEQPGDERNRTSVSCATDIGEKNETVGLAISSEVSPVASEADVDSGMLRIVDPMMIDDDIFADSTDVAPNRGRSSLLGNPPEPPMAIGVPLSKGTQAPDGSAVYVPNVIEDEDDEGEGEDAYESMIPSSGSSPATLNTNTSVENTSGVMTEREGDQVSDATLTVEERGQTELLQEALKGAIEQQLKRPPFVPSIVQALRGSLGPFRFKGFGSSMVKPLNKVHSFGLGLRVPLSACFPQYDANVRLPRLSSMLSVFNTYEESYLRLSVSTSLPARVVAYYLAFLGFKARCLPLAVSEGIRLRRAPDSVKRMGCTFSIRYGTANGFRWAIGPWVYYLPGKKVMMRILPFIFAFPALIIALMNTGVAMEEVLGSFLGLEPSSYSEVGGRTNTTRARTAHAAPLPPAGSYASAPGQPHIDIDDDLVPAGEDYRAVREESPPPAQAQVMALAADVLMWHNHLLKWAATKTTGLGFNVGYGKTQGQDASYRASVAFDVQPFFPAGEVVPLLLWRMYRGVQGIPDRTLGGLWGAARGMRANNQYSSPVQRFRSGVIDTLYMNRKSARARRGGRGKTAAAAGKADGGGSGYGKGVSVGEGGVGEGRELVGGGRGGEGSRVRMRQVSMRRHHGKPIKRHRRDRSPPSRSSGSSGGSGEEDPLSL